MKKLLLIRHAEAIAQAEAGDYARPLSAKGQKDASTTAGRLKNKGLIPQYIISSPAVRTKTTAQTLAQVFDIEHIQFDELIYEASEQTLLNVINSLNNEYSFAAIVGHNPGISYLLYNLTNEIREVPPGTAILVTFEIDEWAAISHGSGTVTYYAAP